MIDFNLYKLIKLKDIFVQGVFSVNKSAVSVGIDIGSTTAKIVIIKGEEIVFQRYERHLSKVRQKTLELMLSASEHLADSSFSVAISGSAGLGVSKSTGIPFVQEVYATGELIRRNFNDASAVVELGGEDAKILFFDGANRVEERMNGSCAGGTGAFIDQMATLLNVTPDALDALALKHECIYSIASRCGVFAKTDIQPLLNQGARKEDIAASIFQAVVDQTISGLAQGRKIEGKVVFLGGPLFFFKALRDRFTETLNLNEHSAIFPDWALYAVSMGAALCGEAYDKYFSYNELIDLLESATDDTVISARLAPLFENEADYDEFRARHTKADVRSIDVSTYAGKAYLGIDCGSTTTKLCLISEDNSLLYSYYNSNKGNPLIVVKDQLEHIYELCADRITIAGSAVTGYGEELIKSAFGVDLGLVETMAHLKAAKYFNKNVDFVLDIGGQDIKCFKIHKGVIDHIILNEACSSGCGSFLETFAKSLGMNIADFAVEGLFAASPTDLGSRCTVFMNSSVKQAQKEGASLGDISAGLSISVVKNALYKVIRVTSKDELGKNIVVQGGTFLNDAVLRSFEKEIGGEVVRPSVSGLMGAYGAALYAKELELEESSIKSSSELSLFVHRSNTAVCKLCTNNCNLTVNFFEGNRKFISGNRCERPISGKSDTGADNMFRFKLDKIKSLKGVAGARGKMGIPLGLNIYENLPFWHAFFTALDFEVVVSDISTRDIYRLGQDTIPSDTACYPAKLMHGHMVNLMEKGVERIFYPCMPYNFKEDGSDNHYNCPVVAYYPELIEANMSDLERIRYYNGYFGIHRKGDFAKKAQQYFAADFNIPLREMKRATELAYKAHERWMQELKIEALRVIESSRMRGKKIVVLAGRPYHVDPEINHGLDQLISSLNLSIVTEDAVAHLGAVKKLDVINQWTYHARLYKAAEFVTKHDDIELIQIVSFGCGLDSIVADEVRAILEAEGKMYTQLKIDEINNLGAIKIRIRSLLSALEEKHKRSMDNGTSGI